MGLKQYSDVNVYDAAVARVKYTFDKYEKIYVSYSGGKDSTVMFHLMLDEAIKRNRKVGILIIDLEAQYNWTISHIEEMVGNAMESWLVDVRIKHSKPAPTPDQRKEIGKILDQIRINQIKRKGSSNNKIYYDGLK